MAAFPMIWMKKRHATASPEPSLFPLASVLQELGEHRNAIELKELGLLKKEFGLSMAGILYRARDLGIISPAYREEQAKLFRFKGWRRKEPGNDFPAEKAHIFAGRRSTKCASTGNGFHGKLRNKCWRRWKQRCLRKNKERKPIWPMATQ